MDTQRRTPPQRVDRAAVLVRRSLWLLLWLPLGPIVGFALASRLLSEDWPMAQVLPLAVVLAAPFVVGAWSAVQALRGGRRAAWALLVVHGALALVALVVPITESLG